MSYRVFEIHKDTRLLSLEIEEVSVEYLLFEVIFRTPLKQIFL